MDDNLAALLADVREVIEEPCNNLIAHLGESPEAWRGAIAAMEYLFGGVSIVHETCVEAGATTTQRHQIEQLIVMAAMHGFVEHPTTKAMAHIITGK